MNFVGDVNRDEKEMQRNEMGQHSVLLFDMRANPLRLGTNPNLNVLKCIVIRFFVRIKVYSQLIRTIALSHKSIYFFPIPPPSSCSPSPLSLSLSHILLIEYSLEISRFAEFCCIVSLSYMLATNVQEMHKYSDSNGYKTRWIKD